MFDSVKSLMPRGLNASRGAIIAAVMLVAGAAVPSALADAGPPEMPAIVLPVDAASVAEQIALVGGTILLLVFGVSVGFALAKKLKSRITRST